MAAEDLILVSVLYSASIFLGWAVTKCIFTKPDVVNTSDCGSDEIGSRKFETRSARKKRCRLTTIQETTKMPYRYSKIYNASQGKWARDVSGEANATKVWLDNEWSDGDALVGFYSGDDCDNYEVIYCDDGYAVYVLGEADKEKANFHFGPIAHRVPPVVLVNLNNAYDAVFLRKKSNPAWFGENDDCDCDSDSESDAMSEDDTNSSDSDDNSCSDYNEKITRKYPKLFSRHSENDSLIHLLQKCRNNTDNIYKKKAYTRAIIEILSINYVLNEKNINNLDTGESIKRKITEYLMGFPEDDIINS